MVIGLVEEEIRDDYCFVVIHLILHFKSKLNSNRQSGIINSFFGKLMARHSLSHLLYLLLNINLIIQTCALAILQPVPFMQRKINLEKKKKRKKFGETFVGLLENDRYPNGAPHLVSYLVLQQSPL